MTELMQESPSAFPRRILLAITGLSPQIVTETVYALAMAPITPFIPTEIHLVTTAEGAERARLMLLHDQTGWFYRLCRDYSLGNILFDPTNIHTLTDSNGQTLEDIRSPEDNEYAADLITEQIRKLTQHPESALHVSIAGGRKTMGFYAGYALSLYGRPQDRLSHVLVGAPFESHPDFFYPTSYSRVIFTPGPDSRPLDTQNARVTLAEIPFVRLRDGLPKRLLQGRARFSETVATAQKALQPASLVIDPRKKRIIASEESVTLAPAHLAFYSWMARRRKNGSSHVHWSDSDIHTEYLEEYGAIVGTWSGEYERVENALKNGLTKDWFDQRKSKTNDALCEALGEQLAKPYLIKGQGKRPETRFGLALDPEAICYA